VGFNGPRKMTILLPGITEKAQSKKWVSQSEEGTLFSQHQRGNPEVLVLQNKTPQWSEESLSFVLNFGGRVTHASVKNFQLISELDREFFFLLFCVRGFGPKIFFLSFFPSFS